MSLNVISTMEGVLTSVRITMAASPAHVVQGTSLNLEMMMTPPMQEDSVKVATEKCLH